MTRTDRTEMMGPKYVDIWLLSTWLFAGVAVIWPGQSATNVANLCLLSDLELEQYPMCISPLMFFFLSFFPLPKSNAFIFVNKLYHLF